MTRLRARAAALLSAGLLAACGGNSTPSGPSSSNVQTITITAAGASPRNVTVSQGERVRFLNNDNRAHDMTSDPHPEHTNCPELNQVGLLQPGQSRETANLVQPKTCGFHDHINPDAVTLQGSIVIR
jgi:plastocyanin